MKGWFAKSGRRLIPTDDESNELIDKLGDGECALFEVVRPRSVPMHRMYFGICRAIGKNQDPQRDEESIDGELRVLAGHYNVVPIHGVEGVEIRTPKRIAFAKLTHDEWMQLWPSLELAIRETFGEQYLQERMAG